MQGATATKTSVPGTGFILCLTLCGSEHWTPACTCTRTVSPEVDDRSGTCPVESPHITWGRKADEKGRGLWCPLGWILWRESLIGDRQTYGAGGTSPDSLCICLSRTQCLKPVPNAQSGPIATLQGSWLWLLECIIFFLFSTSSSHLDPAATPHSTLQGNSAVTPEHPSVIDPLMEQDEGPGTPPAKQSTPSSRSA